MKVTRGFTCALLAISCSFSPAQAARVGSWPIANSQHQNFLKWADQRAKEVETRDESIDSKADKALTADEAYIKFNVPSPVDLTTDPVSAPDSESIREISKTLKLYYRLFGKGTLKSFLWSGIETGNTLTANMDYRWNSLKEAGFYDKKLRAKFISSLKQTGVKNLRFGFSNHEIYKNADGTWNEKSWQAADEMIRDLTSNGIDLSLDLHHFGIETRMMAEPRRGQKAKSESRVLCVDADFRDATYKNKSGDELCDKSKYDPTKSFYLHPSWPNYFADFSLEAFRRYHKVVKAFTFINEPETVKGFNSGLWHGAWPGWGTSPIAGKFEAERAINIGYAAVLARLKIEEFVKRKRIPESKRPIYLHTEAMVPKPKWPDFNNFIRYITSDTILGADWVMKYDFARLKDASLPEVAREVQWELAKPEDRTVLHLLTSQTIWWGFTDGWQEQEARKKHFFAKLEKLQAAHKLLKARYQQTMRSYTVLGIDYYAHNEEGLEPKPELYTAQIKAGLRDGMYKAARAYFERYQMALMVTESGTPYMVHGARWHQQMLFECAKLAKAGIPFLGYTMYPAIDTYGWEHAISRPKEPLYVPEGSLYNPSGLVYMKDQPPEWVDVPGFKALEPKPFVSELNYQLQRVIPR